MQRRSLLCGGFRHKQRRAAFEVEGGEIDLTAQFWQAFLLPMKATRDHQMDHQEQVIFQDQYNPLANSTNAYNTPSVYLRDRRLGRTQQKRAGKAHTLQPPVDD